jgi:hypothetical protein
MQQNSTMSADLHSPLSLKLKCYFDWSHSIPNPLNRGEDSAHIDLKLLASTLDRIIRSSATSHIFASAVLSKCPGQKIQGILHSLTAKEEQAR